MSEGKISLTRQILTNADSNTLKRNADIYQPMRKSILDL